MSSLIPIESINALEVFTEDGIYSLLNSISIEVSNFESDVSTAKGRAGIKSNAYKIILSKGVIDRAGIELNADLKRQTGIVDAARLKARNFLDELASEHRRPFTEWEAETAALQAAAKHKRMIVEVHDAALAEHDVWLREQELARKEAKLKAEEEERQKAEEVKKAASLKFDHEERLKKQANIRAREEAEQKVKTERDRADQAERDQKESEAKAEQDKNDAVEAERKRLFAEQEERRRIAEEQAEGIRKAEEALQANKVHRRDINRLALAALVENNIEEESAKEFITLVFQGKIPGIRMDY